MSSTVTTALDIHKIRADFPVLDQMVNGKPLVYFDNAATSQKPSVVIDALSDYYLQINSNIHRGLHTLAEKATAAFEETRKRAQQFIHAREAEEIVFTKGTTEGINLVASTYGRKFIGKDDEIIITGMEHHSNIVPWQMLCEEKGAVLKVVPVQHNGEILIEDFEALLSEKTRLVSVVYASNALGTVNPVKEITKKAQDAGAKVLIDGAQAAPHLALDVQELKCDFLAFSAHKAYGPTGTGVLYGRREILEKIPPYQGGGEMIKEVHFSGTTYNDIPYKFEAGTPNIGEVVAFKAAMDYIDKLGKEKITVHEHQLLAYGTEKLATVDGFQPVGTASNKVSVISFNIEDMHPFDIGMMLDAKGIAVRTGHHCAQPLMDRFAIEGTVRASFAVYNTKDEIDAMVDGLKDIVKKYRK